MNALKSMMKATARVRHDGSRSADPGRASGRGRFCSDRRRDEVPAGGRIIAASALQIVTQTILSIGGVDLEQGPRHRPRPNSPAQG